MSSKKKADQSRTETSSPDSASTTTGWATEQITALREAEALKATKKSGQASPKKNDAAGEQQRSKPVQETSARDQLLALTAGSSTVASLKKTLEDARELAGSQELVDRFISHIDSANALAAYKLGMQEVDGVAWDDMTWQEKEEQLRVWASEDDDQADAIVHELDKFLNANAAFKKFLYELVNQFIDPLTRIANVFGLKRFLDEAQSDGWVNCFRNPHWDEKNGIAIQLDKTQLVYVPAKTVDRKEKPRIARAWPYIDRRLKQVQVFQEGLDKLREQSDRWLTPAKISNGKTGHMFVQTGATSAVLIEAFENAGEIVVRVSGSFGCDENRLPSDVQLWNKTTHRPENGNVGSWAFITRSMDFQARRQEAHEKKREENREGRTAPLTKVATFGTRYEDQGLTKAMITGEQGVAAFWNPRFRWQQREGFFGLAINHADDNGSFILSEVVSDLNFPEELIGTKLPFAVDSEKFEVNFIPDAPHVNTNLYHALNMVRVAINWRLQIEKRNAPVSTTTTSEPVSEENNTDGK